MGIQEIKDMDNELNLKNYPNPSSKGNFSVEYKLQKASDVSVTILDVSGNIVLSNVIKKQELGIHTFHTDNAGYTPGLYFCRLLAGSKIAVNKFIVQ
jgi:hypothetical protein